MLWRIDESVLGEKQPVFKLHYGRQGKLELTGMHLPCNTIVPLIQPVWY